MDADAQLAEFSSWAVAAGIEKHECVELVRTPSEGIGVQVGGSGLRPDDVAVAVPRGAALSLSTLPGIVGSDVLASSLEHTHALALAISLLAAQEPCPLRPWLALWPSEPEGSWGFTAESWAELAWCDELRELHEGAERSARAAFDEVIVPHFSASGGAAPGWRAFLHALSMVSSRAADGVVSSERQPALVPLVDMSNHRDLALANAKICFEPADDAAGGRADRFVVRAVRDET